MTNYRQGDAGADDTARVVGRSGGADGLVWKVTTAVLAIVVVALVYLLSRDSATTAMADTPEGAAETACAMLASAKAQDTEGDEDETLILFGKLSLAQSFAFLAQAYAGEESTEYDWLSEVVRAPREVESQVFDHESEAVQEALQESVDTCADHGF